MRPFFLTEIIGIKSSTATSKAIVSQTCTSATITRIKEWLQVQVATTHIRYRAAW